MNAREGGKRRMFMLPKAVAILTRQPILLVLPLLLPAIWRLAQTGVTQPAGLLSDFGSATLVFSLLWYTPRLFRPALLLFWCLIQIGASELLGAVHRLPSWQDARYLLDPVFLHSSTAGLHLQAPGFTATLIAAATIAAVAPIPRSSLRTLTAGLLTVLLLLPLHDSLARTLNDQKVDDRYQVLHWLIIDAAASAAGHRVPAAMQATLPDDLLRADLGGRRLLLPATADRSRNVLLIVLEGIPGLYLPDIGSAVVGDEASLRLPALAEATASAMLVPAFVTHSHQTIRGLYAIHCGDFSKLSFTTPKAFELQNAPQRSAQCLPARLAAAGYQTHYLQGAPLAFMNKDRAMPTMGFQQVHGLEWFPENTGADFIWGASDDSFFRGAANYIDALEQQQQPWFLSLLTVATHQPYAADEKAVQRYGSRQAAAIAHLDQAIARFLDDLRSKGTLDDTLVVITSDESHGAPGAGWYSSWGLAIVLAPEQDALPRLKSEMYGLVDIEVSILDYLELPIPPAILGRSLFRDYDRSRTMVSYTGGLLRWQTADGSLYECSRDAICRSTESPMIGTRPEQSTTAAPEDGAHLFALADQLDRSVAAGPTSTLQFAGGEVRTLPVVITNDWTDNLIGAQYLDFPHDSTIRVDIGVQALSTEPEGLRLQLTMRQFEQEVTTITPPTFPLLHSGESCSVSFSFTNEQARQAFSFHLLGAGENTRIRLDTFTVQITPDHG
ncbi:LTA synthase family protein [Desulfofustis glycolicus]|nr:LTA synthase family protein [Desulfofustis glycolicus]MCB2214966.1 LTA synthase family protein [Desulfobulbaceae bacterium]